MTPIGIAIASPEEIYVVDADADVNGGHGLLVKVDSTGAQQIVSGDAATSLFAEPNGIAIESDGRLLVADRHAFTPNTGQGAVFRVDPDDGAQCIVSATDTGPTPKCHCPSGGCPPDPPSYFDNPFDVVVDRHENIIVGESGFSGNGGAVVCVDSNNGVQTRLASGIPLGGLAPFVQPVGVEIDSAGDILVADTDGDALYKVSAPSGPACSLPYDENEAPTTLLSPPAGSTNLFISPTGLGVAPQLVDPEFARTVVFAENSVWIRQNSDVMTGSIVVNRMSTGPTLDSQVELSVGLGATSPAGYDLKADSVKIKNNAVVTGDVTYNDLIENGTVTGTKTTPLDLPVFDPLPPFQPASPGSLDVIVDASDTQILYPGDYRDVTIKRGGTLILTGGLYNTRSVDVGNAASLLVQTSSDVRIADRFSSGQNSSVGPEPGAAIDASDIIFYIAGINGGSGSLQATPKAAKIGLFNIVSANFYVPNGTLLIKQGTVASGAFLGRDVQVGINVQISLDSFLAP